ncbi:MAG: GAF domain-containing protein [Kaiparowitsia implicata GSE-PSE-MK54-09C]|jgi:GAF domain-containing protein|nr:GAF domain-containing protein [Kaiparowitsia implicata GSE-PSE-MK54-09C]
MSTQFDPEVHLLRLSAEPLALKSVLQRLNQTMQRDHLVQETTDGLRRFLQVDRVLLYRFYSCWEGQVTFESLSDRSLSILGSTGPDQCFNDEYAALYLAGRVRAIANIEAEPIQPCHRDFLRYLQVQANLVVPILTPDLWGLLAAHHCQSPRAWSEADIEQMSAAALTLASAPSIQTSR